LTPALIQGLAPEVFADKSVTYGELMDKYADLFKEYPTGNDAQMLKDYGFKGLQMIVERKAAEEKGSGGMQVTLN